ncbi:MAG: hypothetical protein ABI772_09700 [Bacteroidota bacterium]
MVKTKRINIEIRPLTLAFIGLFIFSQLICNGQLNSIEVNYSFPAKENLLDNTYQNAQVKSQILSIQFYKSIIPSKTNGFFWNAGLDFSFLKLVTSSKESNNTSKVIISILDYKGLDVGFSYQFTIFHKARNKITMRGGVQSTFLLPIEEIMQLVRHPQDSITTFNELKVNYTDDNRIRFTVNYNINYSCSIGRKNSIGIGARLTYDLNTKRKIDYVFLREDQLIEAGKANFKNLYFSLPVTFNF